MSEVSTIVLLPFIVAFLTFALRFYARESAASMKNLSFLLGLGTVLVAFLYLGLRVTDMLPPFGTIGFGVIGVALLVTAIARMFML